jgi:hypothetical protein
VQRLPTVVASRQIVIWETEILNPPEDPYYGTISVLREQVPMLMPEADKQVQDLFFELLVPQPGGYFLDPIDVGDVTTLGVPAGYILSADDRALARPGTEFAARIGLTPVLVSGGHESMLTRPDEVAKALLER